jgi:hypothetical protein
MLALSVAHLAEVICAAVCVSAGFWKMQAAWTLCLAVGITGLAVVFSDVISAELSFIGAAEIMITAGLRITSIACLEVVVIAVDIRMFTAARSEITPVILTLVIIIAVDIFKFAYACGCFACPYDAQVA